MTQSLVCPGTVSRVSSVLNRNSRQFGKKHLFDQNEETCWNSDQGPSQWVTLEFPQRVHVAQLQGRGVGRPSARLQISTLRTPMPFSFCTPTVEVDRLKLTFEDTTDFFGRVVIYHLRVLGEKAV
ncbi:nuclear receptor 2C2-associated protein isoform X2 [Meriones unguiculatus]|uniref:nuclear receptor 2C2-associated protein isoform X2 n=1 Tax=Meriones unguiculatus TaxID=10047 RepID=UPI00293F3E19|nr:nuclear receptor 2C2-associated protein isoform X2 [Meriones unguiculatus]